MNKLNEFLSELKENKLNKTYDRIITDLTNIKSALSVVNEEVNDAILGLLSEGKYEEVNKLTSIPAMSTAIIDELEKVLNDNVLQEEVKKDEELNDFEKTENLQYAGIITSIKGLEKGAQVFHKSFGLGKIVSLEENPNSDYKILNVYFDSCGEKPFNCSPEILSKYFDIVEKEIVQDIPKLKHDLDISGHLKELLEKVENIIFEINSQIEKSQTNTYYKYILNNKVICSINCNPKRINLFFNIPMGNMVDNENLLIDVSNKGHIGIGDYKLAITKDMNIDYLYANKIKNYLSQTIKYYEK